MCGPGCKSSNKARPYSFGSMRAGPMPRGMAMGNGLKDLELCGMAAFALPVYGLALASQAIFTGSADFFSPVAIGGALGVVALSYAIPSHAWTVLSGMSGFSTFFILAALPMTQRVVAGLISAVAATYIAVYIAAACVL